MRTGRERRKYGSTLALALAFGAAVALGGAAEAQVTCTADNTITADVVVLDNPTVFNRLGAQNPNWITYALKRDVVNGTTLVPCSDPTAGCAAGNVQLRPDKRTRPLVLRSIEGYCLNVNFTNLLDPAANPNNEQQGPAGVLINNNQVADRCAGFHATGTELVGSIASDGSQVGVNPGAELIAAGACGSGLVAPGATITYNLYTPHEGAYIINSYGATVGSEGNGGNLGLGMFGALNVEPKGASIYRSQVTEEEMRLATVKAPCPGNGVAGADGLCRTPAGQPIINYEALYPNVQPWISEGKAGLPVLNMLTATNELVHSDINAIVAGPNPNGTFPPSTYPLESVGKNNPALPNRLEPFREYTSVFHDEQTNTQVFPNWYKNPVLGYTLHGVGDAFMINYGSGGIGSEIISNRLHTGPMYDCTGCAYEEFFLSSSTVGDPALLVQFPANTGIEACDPRQIVAFNADGTPAAQQPCWRNVITDATGAVVDLSNGPIPGNFALFQEDPTNVHHGYTGDFVKIRNIHAGAFEQHIFHLHNHQWLLNPNDDNANYLDAQEIMPGSGHTYELVNGGAGNRNKTTGDAIFHCHFYPHFAQGMWYHIRNQDVMETGTVLAVSGGTADAPGFHTEPFALRNGKPAPGSRALADGELPDGAPIPATVPLPGKAMPPMPARVAIVPVDRGAWGALLGRSGPDGIPDSSQAVVDRTTVVGPDGLIGTPDDVSPGYPFFIAGYECGDIDFPAPGQLLTGMDELAGCPKGVVGQRMPTPPLDLLTEGGAATIAAADPTKASWPALAGGWDGGLPRHTLLGYVSGGVTLDTQNRLDFSKIIELAQPVYYEETGTDIERASMAYHAVRDHSSFANNLNGFPTSAVFHLNGAPPVPGGPFQDPCIDDAGTPLKAGVLGAWFDGDGLNNPAIPSTLTTRGASNFTSENPRTYKIANIQIDAVFNKVGYHYPQERIISLWDDVADTVNKLRPPEPLVMRFNTFDCGKILHANLVPAEFELDDFQVRTPTDIIGQHIHLPKWDLTTNDGAANGWNYEDGTLAPGIVVERIKAINEFNHYAGTVVPADTLPGQPAPLDLTGLQPVATLTDAQGADPGAQSAKGLTHLTALPHPYFGPGPATAANPQTGTYLGARTTIQRILVDPLVNVAGVDRGLGLTFSHDHYGPSTFQQIGLYSTILAEPAGSTWMHNETGVALGTRHDGGPTSWQAIIEPPAGSPVEPHREFYFEMSDFQHAYEAGVYVGADPNGLPLHTPTAQTDPFDATQAFVTGPNALGFDAAQTWQQTVNPPLKLIANGGVNPGAFPDVLTAHNVCPGPLNADGTGITNASPFVPRPCAEAINISHSSMFVINYRNEPVGLRVFDPNGIGPDGQKGTQAAGLAGDLAFAFQSRKDRAIAALNTSLGNTPYPAVGTGDGINRDRQPGDPFTPIMRAYERDEIKVKIQTGATEEQHQASIHGVKWLSNGSGFGAAPNSGWRNFQSAGISEQFTLHTPVNPDPRQRGISVDYLYGTDVTRDGMWSGTWGILRNYGRAQGDLAQLSNNPIGARTQIVNQPQFAGVCPDVDRNGIGDSLRPFDVSVVLANDVLPNSLGVNIPANAAPVDNVGGPLNPLGGTLVYNRRQTVVPDVLVGEPGAAQVTIPGGAGPLNDPTAILYVRTADLVVVNPADPGCALIDPATGLPRLDPATGVAATDPLQLPTCPVTLAPDAPVEPVVLRANAGDCIQVTLRNRLPGDLNGNTFFDDMPDLAGWQDMMWVVNRDLFNPVRNPLQMRFFNNNLVRPSSHAGIHAQLVAFDSSRDDGTVVGQNAGGNLLAPPGGATISTFYAGDLRQEFVGERRRVRQYRIVATPVEFGATNLLSSDRIKQPQKGLFGSLVIEPAGATYPNTLAELTAVGVTQEVPDGQANEVTTPGKTRLTRAQVTVDATANPSVAGSNGTYREALAIGHKIANLRWADGSAIINVNQGELGREGAEDSGHAGFNYGMEPSWFRFQLPPNVPFGNALTPNSFGGIANAHAMYANALVAGEPNAVPLIPGVSQPGDPATPVFRATADTANANPVADTRMYVLNGASADRDGAFVLHGHVWQRDPYVCTGAAVTPPLLPTASEQDDQVGLVGRCDPLSPVPSNALGLNPQGKWTGGQEGMGHVFGYWPVLFDAGGTDRVAGDYLYRDYSPSGNANGQFGLLRVQ